PMSGESVPPMASSRLQPPATRPAERPTSIHEPRTIDRLRRGLGREALAVRPSVLSSICMRSSCAPIGKRVNRAAVNGAVEIPLQAASETGARRHLPSPATDQRLGVAAVPRRLLLVLPEQHANRKLDLVEGLGADALACHGGQHLDVAVR